MPQKLFEAESEIHTLLPLEEMDFRWGMNQDPMATEKLAEGIRNFTIDQIKLEQLLQAKL